MNVGNGFDPEFAAASDWAREYRACGIQVVPCRDKRPLLKKWKEYQNELVPTPQFDAWYGSGGAYVSHYDMGMLTGEASGRVLMIDLDFYKAGGDKAKQWWGGVLMTHNNGMAMETWQQRTGGGGIQLFFTYPDNWKFAVNAKTDINVDIRCRGGFAVLPPTLHSSGANYVWEAGLAPWEIERVMAPDWLLEEVEKLILAHGHVSRENPSNGTEKINTGNGQAGQDWSSSVNRGQAGQFDAFGHRTDGREEYMRDMVWRCVVDWHREIPIKPPPAESAQKAQHEYGVYERKTRPQRPHPADMTLTQMLDAEGRGWAVWWKKWQAAMAQWEAKVREDAQKPGKSKGEYSSKREGFSPYDDDPDGFQRVDPDTGQPLPLILTGSDFVGTYRPPDYLIDGIIQKGYLYSLTGPTGHGKTPTAMLMGARVALGRSFHGKPTTQGSVLFLAGENPDDIRARYVALSDHEKFDIGSTPFYFIEGIINIAAELPRIQAEAANIPNLSMVIIDTDQAYFLGDEGNSNEQRKWFASTLRQLLKLPGNPTALVNCHPTKNATQDSLVPIGGSAFLNEIDGNITCWAEDRTCTIQPHSTKWRGVAFESFALELRTVTSDRLKDTKGRHIPSIMAVEITEEGAAWRGAVANEDEKTVLRLMHVEKNASIATIAKRAGWTQANGEPAKSRVVRVMERLKKSKFIFRYHGEKYRLTKKGCKYIEVSWEGEKDEK